MSRRATLAMTLSAAAGAGLLVATAFAQTPPGNPPPPANPPAPSAQATPTPPAPGPGPRADQGRGPAGMSSDDRAAFFDARLAAIRAGLRLTPEQEGLWPPVESAVRDMARTMMELREQRRTEQPPAEALDRLARMGEAATKRGQAMTRFADAARPLYASLSDDQKRRLRVLMRHGRDGGRHGMMGRDMMGHDMMDGRGHGGRHEGRGRHDHHDRHGWMEERGRDRYDRRADSDRDERGGWDRDNGRGGYGRGGYGDGPFGGNDWR